MNHKLNTMFNQIAALDTYTQLSVLGSWNYAVNQSCINQAMRYVPETPVDNGIDSYTQYEAGRRALLQDSDSSQLPDLLALQRDIQGAIEDNDGSAKTLSETLQLMMNSAPTREMMGAKYDDAKRAGMKPSMSRKQFIDYELERAVAMHNKLAARGEDAVRICETITIAAEAHDIPETLMDRLEEKLIDKLNTRWEKLEFDRINPRLRKERRDSAAADQLLIETTLAEYGITPGFEPEDDEKEVTTIELSPADKLIALQAAKANMTVPEYLAKLMTQASDNNSHVPFNKDKITVVKAQQPQK